MTPSLRLDWVILPDGSKRYVILDRNDDLHLASKWLAFLSDTGMSPNTVRAYGGRLAGYLSWTSLTSDWKTATLSHLALWRRALSAENESGFRRASGTVTQWLIPLRSFYEWAYAEDLISSDIAASMSEMKYYRPGTAAGGEYGARKKVLVDALKPTYVTPSSELEWVSDVRARQALLDIELRPRDRFLVDLFYYTGIRVGEALSLFTKDMHFGGGSPEIGCMESDPHFHVGEPNAVENDARPKRGARLLHVNERVVEAYTEAVLERHKKLGDGPMSPHVFVTIYGRENIGAAMTYANARRIVRRCGRRIGFPMSGPHVLRHTLATRLVRGLECERVELDVVQAILGHSSLSSTRIYTHDLERAKRAALLNLPARGLTMGTQQ